jgi:hypothetical protein
MNYLKLYRMFELVNVIFTLSLYLLLVSSLLSCFIFWFLFCGEIECGALMSVCISVSNIKRVGEIELCISSIVTYIKHINLSFIFKLVGCQ